MSLSKKAMLVTLNISMIGRSGVDKQATKDANNYLNTTQQAGRYTKCKIHDDDIRGVIQKADIARRHHKRLTRPWDEKKIRILPATLIFEYTQTMSTCKQDFENEVLDIQSDWLNIVMKQQQRLKTGLFDINDYPGIISNGNGTYSVDLNLNLTSYFTFRHDIYPVPDSNHLILDIERETLKELKMEMEKSTREKLKTSKAKLLLRLYEPIANMADILGNDKKIYKTLIPSIEEQIKILPELNVENDPTLNDLIKETKYKLTGYTTGQIREDRNLKSQMAENAQSLKNKIDVFMNMR